ARLPIEHETPHDLPDGDGIPPPSRVPRRPGPERQREDHAMRPDRSLLTLAMLLAALGLPPTTRAEGDRPPNFVVIVADNLGYGDIGPFGSTLHRTPHLDRMAEEGMKLTNFYV